MHSLKTICQKARQAAGRDAIDALPRDYFNRVIASVLASELVYRQGIDYSDISDDSQCVGCPLSEAIQPPNAS